MGLAKPISYVYESPYSVSELLSSFRHTAQNHLALSSSFCVSCEPIYLLT